MSWALRLRGPDDEGVFLDERAGLAHRRLSIIDLAGGGQPMASADGHIQVVHNGEIYNFVELRAELEVRGHRFRTRSDTEVIVHGYAEWGEDVVEHVDGMFAFAVWDTARARLLLARDRFGKKPLCWFVARERFVFASTLTALLRHPACPRAIDHTALAQYLAFEFVPAPRTILTDVHKLEPGTLLTLDRDGTISQRRYFALGASRRTGRAPTASEVEEEIRGRLGAAVRKRLVSDVPLGVLLSGGLDSSSVAAMAAELGGSRLRTFSIGFPDTTFDETRYAREVADWLGTEHVEETLGFDQMLEIVPRVGEILDEPLADSSLIPSYLVSRLARRYVTVVLGGDGGDELFAGYPTYVAHRLLGPLEPLFRPRLVSLAQRAARRLPVSHGYLSFDFQVKKALDGLPYDPEVRTYVWNGGFAPAELGGLLTTPVDVETILAPIHQAYRESPGHSHVERVLGADVRLNLGQRILTKVDRASMASSLEVRAPLLDTALASYVASLPLSEKLCGLAGKVSLKRAMKGRLPERVVRRKKKGFGAPVGAWLRGPLAGFARERLLDSGGLGDSGLVDPRALARLFEEHQRGVVDHRKRLWPLLVLALWRRSHLETS